MGRAGQLQSCAPTEREPILTGDQCAALDQVTDQLHDEHGAALGPLGDGARQRGIYAEHLAHQIHRAIHVEGEQPNP